MYQLGRVLNDLEARLQGLVSPSRIYVDGLFPGFQGIQERFDLEAAKGVVGLNHAVPALLQVTGGKEITEDETSVGFDSRIYGRVALCLVAAFAGKHRQPWLDYKCYSCFAGESCIFPGDDCKNTEGGLWGVIREWVRVCMQDYGGVVGSDRVFRRSLSVSFTTSFKFPEHSKAEDSGHEIAIGMECRGLGVRLLVYDFRAEEYVYNVHELILTCMDEAVRASPLHHLCQAAGAGLEVHRESVCLKHMVHYGNDFMMCMSIAFRVCMYLSIVRDCAGFEETKADFERDSRAYKHHIFRMINWLHHNEEIKNKRAVPIVSPPMADFVFEVNESNCYFMLVPTEKLRSQVQTPRIYLQCMQSHATARLYFDMDGREAFRVAR